MKRLVAVFCLSVLLLVPSAGAYEVDLPGEGNVFNSIPFDKFWSDTRYQQIYDSSIFPPDGGYVTRISFIPDAPGEYSAAVEISLSHTSVVPGFLSTDLDANVTGPETVVFSDSSFTQIIDVPDTLGREPIKRDYNLNFLLDTAFLYIPAEGSLLVDISISGQSRGLSTLKAVMSEPYLSERAWISQYGPGEKESPPVGLFTLFDLDDPPPPPEPEPIPSPAPIPAPIPVTVSTDAGGEGCSMVEQGGSFSDAVWLLLPLVIIRRWRVSGSHFCNRVSYPNF